MSSTITGRRRRWVEETDARIAPPQPFRSLREDLGDGVYITRYTATVVRRLDIGNGVEIVEESREPLPPDTIHTSEGSSVRIVSDWVVWPELARIHEREEEEDANRNNKRSRVPASNMAILSLEEVSAGDAAVAECAVCLQDLVADDKLRAMPCSHAFHQKCIFDWLRINHVCPLCPSAVTHCPTRRRTTMRKIGCTHSSMPVRE